MDANLDWSRPVVVVLPILGFVAGVVAGLAGSGGTIVAMAFWQTIATVFRVPEMDTLGLFVLVQTLQQMNVVVAFALTEWRVWKERVHLCVPYALIVACGSPFGSFCRNAVDTGLVESFIAWLFLAFAAWKLPTPSPRWLRHRCCAMAGASVEAARVDAHPPACGAEAYLEVASERGEPGECGASASTASTAATAATASTATAGGHARRAAPPPQCLRLLEAAEDCGSAGGYQQMHGQAVLLVDTMAKDLVSCGFDDEGVKADDSEPEADLAELDAPPFDEKVLSWSLPLSGVVTGVLCGLCGMGGPPFIVMVTSLSVPKDIARPIFPVGMVLELPVRLAILVWTRTLASVLSDTHVLVLSMLGNQLGLYVGTSLSKFVSQTIFELLLLIMMILSSLLVLGIITASHASLCAIAFTCAFLAARSLLAK